MRLVSTGSMKTVIYAAIVTCPNGLQRIGATSDSKLAADAYCDSWNYLNPMPTDPLK